MFSIDSNIADLKVKERKIFKILYSMNSHPVAMPGYASEDARCYILFFSEGPNLSSFIGLYLSRVDKKFFYRYTSNPFPFEAESDVEDEARAFAEEMGFLLDEIDVSGMAAEDRNTWIEEQFIFGYRTPENTEAGPEAAEEGTAAPQEIEEVSTPAAAPVADHEPETPPVIEFLHEEEVPPSQVAQFQTQTQPQQQSQIAQQHVSPQVIPPQQPLPQAQQPVLAYPPVQQAYQPPGQPPQPPVEEHLVPPELEHPAEPVEASPKPKVKPTPAQHRVPPRKKSPPQAAQSRSAAERTEEELPVELEYEAPEPRPRFLFEEAIKEGVVKPPKAKTARSGAHSPTGVVSRDKEALARLLASF